MLPKNVTNKTKNAQQNVPKNITSKIKNTQKNVPNLLAPTTLIIFILSCPIINGSPKPSFQIMNMVISFFKFLQTFGLVYSL